MAGVFMELTGRSYNRVLFSAAIPTLSEEEFVALWSKIGTLAYREFQKEQTKGDCFQEYGIRIHPITE